jgi:hypothetical protein
VPPSRKGLTADCADSGRITRMVFRSVSGTWIRVILSESA